MRLTKQIREKGTDSLKEGSVGITVQMATQMFRTEAEGKSKSHSEKIERICTMLEKKFNGHLIQIDPMEVNRWLKSLTGSETSKTGIFLKWCGKSGHGR